MATRTLRTCKTCGRATSGPYCDTHKRYGEVVAWASSKGQSAHQRGYGVEWRKARAAVLRDQPLCQACGRRFAKQVDHITPLARGGSHVRENLQALCVECHDAKTYKDAACGRRLRKTKRNP